MPMEPLVEALAGFSEHIDASLSEAARAPVPAAERSVLLVGMGGSGIGGALAAGWLRGRAQVPLLPWSEEVPAGFLGPEDLVIAVSYSGGTAETLAVAKDAVERGARLVAITTGGALGDLARAADAPIVSVPEGFAPRAALGHLFGAVIGVLDGAGVAPGIADEVRRAAKSLDGEGIAMLHDETSVAHQVASLLGPTAVDVVGHDVLSVVARRGAAQLNENSKVAAAHHGLPEACHNAIVPWCAQAPGTTLWLLRRETEAPYEAARYDTIADDAHVEAVVETVLPGEGITQILHGVLLVDAVSLLIAERLGRDPEDIAPIMRLKDRLAAVDQA